MRIVNALVPTIGLSIVAISLLAPTASGWSLKPSNDGNPYVPPVQSMEDKESQAKAITYQQWLKSAHERLSGSSDDAEPSPTF